MKNYYQKEIETASREEILAIQNEKIVKQVKHVYDNVAYYRKLMDDKGVKPEDGPAGRLPLRPAGHGPLQLRPHPFHLRHHGQAGRGLLHPA